MSDQKRTMAADAVKVLVPSGVLGLGFDADALARGIAAEPDVIVIDGGSTDSGPFYLGAGESKYARAATKAEWRALLAARAEAGVPLVIGSAGTCGVDAMVDWMVEITEEIAAERGERLRVATVKSSQDPERTATAWSSGLVDPLAGGPEIDDETLRGCANIVALAGAEHIQGALETGADVIIAGRATDTASVAALPILKGMHDGAAWHAAKIAECGALCSTHPTSGVIMVSVDREGFTVEPMRASARCTPHSVSAHMLYENSDPFVLYEPGGRLDVTNARYAALDKRRVRVTGSEWIASTPYRVKLEASRIAGFQTTILAILRERRYVENAREWADKLHAFLVGEIGTRMGLAPEDYTLEFRLIGVDATLGALENRAGSPVEVGVLGLATAATQDQADEIAKLINPWVLHYPLTEDEELPTFAFPFSPAHSPRGALYEFALHHTLAMRDPWDAFRLETFEIGSGSAAHAAE